MSERLTAFLKTVTDFADAECSDLEYKAQSFKDKNIDSYQKKAEQKNIEFIDYEVSRIKTSVNKTISDYESEKKSALIALRAKITENVFNQVKNKLAEFKNSADYENFLLKSAKSLTASIGDDAVILVSTEDMKYAEVIANETQCKVKEDTSIELGGLRAINSDETIIIDDTFENRLNAEHQDFIKKSNLKIF